MISNIQQQNIDNEFLDNSFLNTSDNSKIIISNINSCENPNINKLSFNSGIVSINPSNQTLVNNHIIVTTTTTTTSTAIISPSAPPTIITSDLIDQEIIPLIIIKETSIATFNSDLISNYPINTIDSSENAKENIKCSSHVNASNNEKMELKTSSTTNTMSIIMNNNNDNNIVSISESAFIQNNDSDDSHKTLNSDMNKPITINDNNTTNKCEIDEELSLKTSPSYLICNQSYSNTNDANTNSFNLNTSQQDSTLRSESQEYAFLQIERVHNYSKASRKLPVIKRYHAQQHQQHQQQQQQQQQQQHQQQQQQHQQQQQQQQQNHFYQHPQFQHRQENEDLKINENPEKDNEMMTTYIEHNVDEDDQNNKNLENETMIHENSSPSSAALMNVPDNDDTPDHHARRPMNAFLIFCKRHRAIVKDKYKNLENRSITKILGDWWATLSSEEKESYTELAKQYKDAFFSAHPNFKWYKLPAPPLRTLHTRPSNIDKITFPSSENYYEMDESSTAITSNTINPLCTDKGTNFDDNVRDNYYNHNFNNQNYHNHHKYLTKNSNNNVGVFKLADEDQMGGISDLIASNNEKYQSKLFNNNNERIVKNEENFNENEEKINIPISSHDPFELMKNHVAKNTNLKKRKAIDDGNMNDSKRFTPIVNDIANNKKSVRACKGKKYQELINSGQITSFIKKLKTKTSSTSPTQLSTATTFDNYSKNFTSNNNNNNNNYDTNLMSEISSSKHYAFNKQLSVNVDNSPYSQNSSETSMNINNGAPDTLSLVSPQTKQFDASDFDLEEKINALPAQNLDNYLQRKRDTKKKRKINTTKRQKSNKNTIATATSNKLNNKSRNQQCITEFPEVFECNDSDGEEIGADGQKAVGSQKRKARKESITRRQFMEQQQRKQQNYNSAQYNEENARILDTVNALVEFGSGASHIYNNNTIDLNDNRNATNVILMTKQETPNRFYQNNTEIEKQQQQNENESHINNDLLCILAEVATNISGEKS